MKKIKFSVMILFVSVLMSLTSKVYAQEPYLGEIRMFAIGFAPIGWAPCNGQFMSIPENTALFSLIGTTYGGNGQTTFALPDLRGRVPMNSGSGNGLTSRLLGEMGGTESVILTSVQLPAHTHTINAVSTAGNTNNPAGNVLGNAGGFDNDFSNATPNINMKSTMVNPTGNNNPVSIMQPYTVINFYIATEGIFPPRP